MNCVPLRNAADDGWHMCIPVGGDFMLLRAATRDELLTYARSVFDWCIGDGSWR